MVMESADDIPPVMEAEAPPPPLPTAMDAIGEEIISIAAPVSICMLLVVLLIASLSAPFSSRSAPSWQEKLSSALVTSLAFVVGITIFTLFIYFLLRFRLTVFLRYFMAFSCFSLFLVSGGKLSALLVRRFKLSLDSVTFSLLLFNFAAVGAATVLAGNGVPILLTQGYVVLTGALIAFWLAVLPEWTVWSLLIAMALYDIAAVLLPFGPFRLLVEIAVSRDEHIPALVYEPRPANPYQDLSGDAISDQDPNSSSPRDSSPADDVPDQDTYSDFEESSEHDSNSMTEEEFNQNSEARILLQLLFSARASQQNQDTRISVAEEELQQNPEIEEEFQQNPEIEEEFQQNPEIEEEFQQNPEIEEEVQQNPEIEEEVQQNPEIEEDSQTSDQNPSVAADSPISGSEESDPISSNSAGGMKLGLGDFVLYSVLVGRAAMQDFMTVYACYFSIIAGLGVTLLLLGYFQRALPALPISVSLGLVFYLLTRFLLEEFLVQCSTNLVMF